MVYLYTES